MGAWFWLSGNSTEGPIEVEEFARLVVEGSLTPDVKVHHAQGDEWVSASSIPELVAAVSAARQAASEARSAQAARRIEPSLAGPLAVPAAVRHRNRPAPGRRHEPKGKPASKGADRRVGANSARAAVRHYSRVIGYTLMGALFVATVSTWAIAWGLRDDNPESAPIAGAFAISLVAIFLASRSWRVARAAQAIRGDRTAIARGHAVALSMFIGALGSGYLAAQQASAAAQGFAGSGEGSAIVHLDGPALVISGDIDVDAYRRAETLLNAGESPSHLRIQSPKGDPRVGALLGRLLQGRIKSAEIGDACVGGCPMVVLASQAHFPPAAVELHRPEVLGPVLGLFERSVNQDLAGLLLKAGLSPAEAEAALTADTSSPVRLTLNGSASSTASRIEQTTASWGQHAAPEAADVGAAMDKSPALALIRSRDPERSALLAASIANRSERGEAIDALVEVERQVGFEAATRAGDAAVLRLLEVTLERLEVLRSADANACAVAAESPNLMIGMEALPRDLRAREREVLAAVVASSYDAPHGDHKASTTPISMKAGDCESRLANLRSSARGDRSTAAAGFRELIARSTAAGRAPQDLLAAKSALIAVSESSVDSKIDHVVGPVIP